MECPACHTSVDASQRFCPSCGTVLAPTEAQVQEDAMIGQTLGGKYKIVRLVGEGGMGAVYEGEQQLGSTKRKVAIKTLHPHLSRDPKIKARFEREVGTVAELEHPNTIQVYDFGASADGILYIVMELLQGKSLAAVLEQEGAMAPDRVERIMQQICGSLEEAHARGIVHRDLKPDNVVLVNRAGKKDFVKVLDFGIAKRAQESDSGEQKLTQQGTVLGTPPYMSPEQFTGRPIDARSDIYSLGVMAYEMLTGKLPFHANTAWEWASLHMNQAPIPIESLAEGMRAPGPMRSAIRRSLAKLPEERFQTVKEFFDAFAGAPEPASAAGAGALGRQKTEMGAPLDVAAAFASPRGPGLPAAMGGPPVQPPAAPLGSNVSFPTPAGIPRPPPRHEARGKGRTLLLVTAGLLCIASIGAIVFAVRGSSSGSSKEVVFDPGGPSALSAPAAPSTVALGTPPTPPPAGSGSDVPPLSAGGGGARVPGPRQPSQHSTPGGAGAGAAPGATHGPAAPTPAPSAAPPMQAPNPGPGPQASPPPVPAPAPNPPKPPAYDGPECATARRLKALGHPKEAESWALACIARGGAP
jgi:serine/threonine-protein kinase